LTATIHSGNTLRVSDTAVLFAMDDHCLPWARSVCLEMERPTKYPDNPIIPRGAEGGCDYHRAAMPAVVRIDDQWRMWYVACHQISGPDQIHIATAVSDDGLNWTKPQLGLKELNGNRNNNLVDCLPGLNTCAVIYEPEAPAEQRFVMIGEDMTEFAGWGHNSPSIARIDISADGLHWRKITDCHTFSQVFEAATVYKFNGKYHIGGHQNGDVMRLPAQEYDLGHYLGPRAFVVSQSPRLGRWPNELVKGFFKPMKSSSPYRTGWDREEVHLGASVTPYANVCVGIYGQWHHPINEGAPVYDGKTVSVDLGLIISNDGLHFREPAPGFSFMKRDQEFRWDRDWKDNADQDNFLLTQGAMINTAEETFIYYGATTPGGNVHEVSENIGLARMPRDRFGYLRLMPGARVGQRVSCPVHVDSGTALTVNAEVPAGSRIRLALLDEDGLDELPGYQLGDGGQVVSSGLDSPVIWNNRRELPIDKSFRIRADLEGAAKLFAIYLTRR